MNTLNIDNLDITKLNIKDLAFLLKLIEDEKNSSKEDLEVI